MEEVLIQVQSGEASRRARPDWTCAANLEWIGQETLISWQRPRPHPSCLSSAYRFNDYNQSGRRVWVALAHERILRCRQRRLSYKAFGEPGPARSFQPERSSLPGVGPVLGPRLLAALGDKRSRLPDARALQCFSGIAPILIRSGLSTVVSRRHACPRFIRQSFHEHASESTRHCHWARAYYQLQKDRGKKHHTITRALAFKWQRILLRCWQTHTPYDDATYMRSLKDRNPILYQLALTTKLPREENAA